MSTGQSDSMRSGRRWVGGCSGRGIGILSGMLIVALLAFVPGTADAGAASQFTFGGPALIDSAPPYSLPAGFATMSCPSSALCVGATGRFGQIVSSTNPGGTSSSDWSQFPTSQIAGTGYSIGGISCVMQGSAPFCLATGTDPNHPPVGNNAIFLRSTNPAGGASAWQAQPVVPSPPLPVPPARAAGASTTV